ncbi:ABC transporter permease subunit [Ferrimonas marina]|uniref:Phosphate transport system permease protein n=1 Tax=Ferrimonas marina TaxID=299255 RepID=A0A1M5SA05_9GAMM|nr:ABC transporter permease subunit [Ferrimonas marina]SHH35311.1 phosphate transport system permease protein [Ferrimonas marina]
MEIAESNRFKSSQHRLWKDRIARTGIVIGGSMVLVALLLIFFYLLYVVTPMFKGARFEPLFQAQPLSPAATLKLGVEESRQYGYRYTQMGTVEFYQRNGEHQSMGLDMPDGASIVSAASAHLSSDLLALGLDNGEVLISQPRFDVSYPNDVRTVTPKLVYPMGSSRLALSPLGQPIERLVFEADAESTTLVWGPSDGPLTLTQYWAELDFLTDEVEWLRRDFTLSALPRGQQEMLISPDQRQLFLWADNRVEVWQIDEPGHPQLRQVLEAQSGARITDIALMAGASSLLIGHDNGEVGQWFQSRIDGERRYHQARQFRHDRPVTALASEHYRRGFIAGDAEGGLSLYHTTSERSLAQIQLSGARIAQAAFAPAGNGFIVESGAAIKLFAVDNPHPEVSWSALWQQVWYEGYPEPDYIWQSTSGSDDFEPKFSLMPLVFGTLKAALYAMVFAVPLAVAGAIYTAFFMSPKVRAMVKPTVEIMEALPTVILGFLAGLWLAPIVEQTLPGILLLLIVLPLVMLLSAYLWHRLPERWSHSRLGQYRELLLIPLLLFTGWACLAVSPWLELVLMDGDARGFVTNELGIAYDQRNALVVGMAMGFAVIPTIFSIAEDAVYSVPRHLVTGSLALGATQWQTLTRVVLLTASPGIFSAVMMGFGRAVGETMIVLMATGNTPLMEWNIFEGMRTLAANIAVEMPESAIDSTHYRVLFLTAFVLFVFTFIFNTFAEYIRLGLRRRYSSL